MSQLLLDASAHHDFPEHVGESLEDGFAVTCAFNRRGTLLAVGCNDGRVAVWDFDTLQVARVLLKHLMVVTSVSWSRDGTRVVSSSTDWSVIVWNVLLGDLYSKHSFETPVLYAAAHPRNNDVLLALPSQGPACLVTIATDARVQLPMNIPDADPANKSDHTQCVVFSVDGSKVFLANSKAQILIIDTETQAILSHFQTVRDVKAIKFSMSGNAFIINSSSDRTIRLYKMSDPSAEVHKFRDHVNRSQWKALAFSANGEIVISGAANDTEHRLHLWDCDKGSLIRTLDGPKEGILDLVWHPSRPVIASVSTFGTIYIWTVPKTENWSAFAPDFKELEENVEYIEREDEFDEVEQSVVQPKKEETFDEFVDIITLDPPVNGPSDDGVVENELVFLPTVPLDENEEATETGNLASSKAEKQAKKDNEDRKRKAPVEKGNAKRPPQKTWNRTKKTVKTATKKETVPVNVNNDQDASTNVNINPDTSSANINLDADNANSQSEHSSSDNDDDAAE